MEEEIRASKERLDYVVTSNPAVILTGKPHSDLKDFDTTYISRNVASILGYEPKEFTDDPKFWERHTHPEDVPRVLSELPHLFRDGHAAYEYRFLHRDGTYRWILEETKVTRDPAGNPAEIIGYLTDIAERRKMENALRESEERHRHLLESMPEHISVLNSEWRYLLVNDALARSVKIPKEQLLGKKVTEFFPGFEKSAFFEAGERVLRSRQAATVTSEYTFEDGRSGWFESHIHPVPEGIMYVAIDITERKRMGDALQTRARQLSAIYSNVSDVLFLLSVEPDDRFRFLSINQSFLDSTGLRENQIVGRDIREVIPEPSLGWVLENYRQAIRDNKTMRWEEVTDYPSGRKCGEVSVAPILDADGRCTSLLGTVHDITERKRLETELVKSRRFATIGETAAMVGHDLRNPLQAIVSTLYLAKRELESLPEPSGEVAVKPGLVDMLETIEKESQYMDKIVSDLQDYAAPLKAEPKPVEMEPLVKDTLLKIRIPQNVKVSLKVSEALQTVMVDPYILRRVFTNLITNAIQAMPDGGELRIDMYGTDESLFIAFKDTGAGIPEENMDKLFNPFFTTKAKGQGLGLPVCKRLVEAHDGRITVESKPGEGSTFTVKLPHVKP